MTLFVVSILVFIGTEMLPGDAASAVLGRSASPTQLAEMRELMGLDKPAAERYADWLGGLLRGDLGNSAAGYAAGGEVPIWGEIDSKVVELVHPRGADDAVHDPALAAARRRSRRCGPGDRRPRHLAHGARAAGRCPSSWSARC